MKDGKYITRVVKYIDKINRYMLNIDSYEMFILYEEKIDAVILNLEQIGETVKKLSETYKQKHPEINWINIAGLRNLIAHEYEEVDYLLIYLHISRKLPLQGYAAYVVSGG
jgi:uncharacterized protein with HEPN domain